MSTQEDREYSRNARNMAIILAAIVLVIFAAIFVPPLVNPVHEHFERSASVTSPYGFTLNINLNTTSLSGTEEVSISGWANNTSSEILNATAANQWAVSPNYLWTRICTNGWPIGVGLMRGYYTFDNYTLGTFVPLVRPMIACPVSMYTPSSFLMQPHSSLAIVRLNGSLAEWNLSTTLTYGNPPYMSQLSGVYTAIAADEWGDVAIVHFRFSA
ncbi:MAG: hypothetical protein LYZ69_02235 [Nitrososphaerales archaeon]|nr:hypothetical protein [Nitrososphaerales archaeon]